MTKQFEIAPEFDAGKFTWVGNKGVAEASVLELKAGAVPYGLVYRDACDVGMRLRNLKKGTFCDFILTESTADEWRFESLDGKFKAVVLND